MKKPQLSSKHVPLAITVLLFVVLFTAGAVKYPAFLSMQVFFNLFIDNAYLIILAIGMTFVLVIGGIDLSVGSVLCLVCMASAHLVENKGMNPYAVMVLMVLIGAVYGLIQGSLIQFFKMQPFIVTLAGLFFGRGAAAWISIETINITNKTYNDIAHYRVHLWGDNFISIGAVIALVVLVLAIYIAHYTKFGRSAYAIGGNESSAMLMGLPVARTKVLVYTLSGVCSALAGIVFSFYMLSGYSLHGQGMELDAIASAVIGGTLLTGGVGYVIGSLFGALTQGIIQNLIMFDGTLNSWWTKIVIAALLCVFIIIQRLLVARRDSQKAKGNVKTAL
ncbi:monosaccharide ABC transporter membrane protein (CUT2 family) [Anaerobacterium chartisolvens]|uniref:Monosaccharide ABC transporter membrane protein (CUT2 family) n=1 Tax=Anaerobacterium chartisolvens TaxID=1297424 RepID=A0A369B337_9FIRM|nr:galactofuranose ABC transporter, permease protein YjfF [Anaerobacterium chartisolvens]RCX14847.1 monosaccharide ABC transporter membrane protein (CUT2 family) [Anaerobacterium chartisolvens]